MKKEAVCKVCSKIFIFDTTCSKGFYCSYLCCGKSKRKDLKLVSRICECGCNTTFVCYEHLEKRFIHGHNSRISNKGKTAWNKGLTKDTDLRIKKYAEGISKFQSSSSFVSRKKGKTYISRETRYCKCGCGKSKIVKVNESWQYFLGHFKPIKPSFIKNKSLEEYYGKEKAAKIRLKKSISLAKRITSGEYSQKSNLYKTGYFFSQKNNKQLFYRSSYELQAFKMLEQMSEVLSYEYESIHIPYYYDGRWFNYFPDILIKYISGRKEIVEVKPKFRLNDAQCQIKLAELRKYCQENDIVCSIWTEEELFSDGKL